MEVWPTIKFVDSFLNQFDICLIQEHWLLFDQLSLLDFYSQFCSVGISGMICSNLIFRKSLLPVVTKLNSISTHFCAISINTNSVVTLFICVYLPTNYNTSHSSDLFLETLCELKEFIESYCFDNIIIGGISMLIFLGPSLLM